MIIVRFHAIIIFKAMAKKEHTNTEFMELKLNLIYYTLYSIHLMDLLNCIEIKTFLRKQNPQYIVNRCLRGKLNSLHFQVDSCEKLRAL